MALTLVTLRPAYDINANWFRSPNTTEPNTNWSSIGKEQVDDSEFIYEWLSSSPWFDDPEIYLCNSYFSPGILVNPSILISVRAKAVPCNELLVGVSSLRVFYHDADESEYYTDFTLTPSWVTYQREIPFDWSFNPITHIRFNARVDDHASDLYVSQIYFDLMTEV